MNKHKNYANLVIIGGTIAAGKSSLVKDLSKRTNWYPVPEIRENDHVQKIILEKLYQGARIHQATIQYYFITNRYMQYKNASSEPVTSIIDRGSLEDWFFAKLLMVDEPKSYEHFKKLWTTINKKIIGSYGAPKAYIYLKVNWENFKKRIFMRNRKAEIENFNANEKYFKLLLKEYNNNFETLLREWNIEPIIIDTNSLLKEQVLEETLRQLKLKEII